MRLLAALKSHPGTQEDGEGNNQRQLSLLCSLENSLIVERDE